MAQAALTLPLTLAASDDDLPGMTAALLQSRQTVLPKRQVEPGPSAQQLNQILQAAANAPDHGQLLPWRFVLVPGEQRQRLADAFADALLQRDPNASARELAQAREKAFRAPLLLLAILHQSCGDPGIAVHERLLSAGCALQNMLLMATAQGLGSALTSGQALASTALRTLFGLQPDEQALCFVSVGTVAVRKPARARPRTADYFSVLSPADAGDANPCTTTDQSHGHHQL